MRNQTKQTNFPNPIRSNTLVNSYYSTTRTQLVFMVLVLYGLWSIILNMPFRFCIGQFHSSLCVMVDPVSIVLFVFFVLVLSPVLSQLWQDKDKVLITFSTEYHYLACVSCLNLLLFYPKSLIERKNQGFPITRR